MEMELQSALEFLRQTPDLVQDLTSGLPRERQSWRPAEGEFSILENVCHLRDIEAEGYTVRIHKILTEDNPLLLDLDGGRLAIERQYNSGQLVAALEEFRTARSRSLAELQSVSQETFARRGELEIIGPVTLWEMVLKMVEHDRGHIQEIKQLSEM